MIKSMYLSLTPSDPQCRDLRHENLNPYTGFLADPVHPCIVMEYCSRGSLNDIIHNEDFKLDWDFKLSLLTDLVRVRLDGHGKRSKTHTRPDQKKQQQTNIYIYIYIYIYILYIIILKKE